MNFDIEFAQLNKGFARRDNNERLTTEAITIMTHSLGLWEIELKQTLDINSDFFKSDEIDLLSEASTTLLLNVQHTINTVRGHCGNPHQANTWLTSPHIALDNKTPLSLCKNQEGMTQVRNMNKPQLGLTA